MMNNRLILVFLLVIVASVVFLTYWFQPDGIMESDEGEDPPDFTGDFDPLGNIEVVFRLDGMRTVDVVYNRPPVFFVEISIDGKTAEFGDYKGFARQPLLRYKVDVDDRKETVNVVVRIIEKTFFGNHMCDISPRRDDMVLDLTYSLRTGTWEGDDQMGDNDGYGHATGILDGNDRESDYEIWFDIYQTDFDGDRLTYWEETYLYGTDPKRDNRNDDMDGDGIPMCWEDTYGYDPFQWDNHSQYDPDRDGLDNLEEWKTSQWHSDPFAPDIFVEVDFIDEGPGRYYAPVLSEYVQQQVISAFTRKGIALHIDDGTMGGGGDILPFVEFLTRDKLPLFYTEFFLHSGDMSWRRGVFHYCLMGHYTFPENPEVAGYATWSNLEEDIFDIFVLGTRTIKDFRLRQKAREMVTAGIFMHELGHTLGLFREVFPGIDNVTTNVPWRRGWWIYADYKSCMNYRYAWNLVDYSEGDNGNNDFDDWGTIDLAFFQKKFFAP